MSWGSIKYSPTIFFEHIFAFTSQLFEIMWLFVFICVSSLITEPFVGNWRSSTYNLTILWVFFWAFRRVNSTWIAQTLSFSYVSPLMFWLYDFWTISLWNLCESSNKFFKMCDYLYLSSNVMNPFMIKKKIYFSVY